ncbi:MAG: hypothetical protein KJZ78_16370 [Bryobacteraceae bacterium]|nr:hypothetical protein [Bryobacteraceae bacterium]
MRRTHCIPVFSCSDGFVWDETFHVRDDQKGTDAVPGYGDDTGPSDMNDEQIRKTMALFRPLGNRKLELEWIEESGARRTYKGRPVPTE